MNQQNIIGFLLTNPHSPVQLRQKNMFQILLLEVHFLLTPMTLVIMVSFLLILFVSLLFLQGNQGDGTATDPFTGQKADSVPLFISVAGL